MATTSLSNETSQLFSGGSLLTHPQQQQQLEYDDEDDFKYTTATTRVDNHGAAAVVDEDSQEEEEYEDLEGGDEIRRRSESPPKMKSVGCGYSPPKANNNMTTSTTIRNSTINKNVGSANASGESTASGGSNSSSGNSCLKQSHGLGRKTSAASKNRVTPNKQSSPLDQSIGNTSYSSSSVTPSPLYPFMYHHQHPTYHLAAAAAAGFTTAPQSTPSTNIGTNQQQQQQQQQASSSRRNGKGKKGAALSNHHTGPSSEYRLFFNLRRRDSTSQSNNKGSGGVYKPKQPPSVQEWFKRLTVEERVNCLSTVCPQLSETMINMCQRAAGAGEHSQFARISNTQGGGQSYHHGASSGYYGESRYFGTTSPYHYPGFSPFYSSPSTSLDQQQQQMTFDDQYYHRQSSLDTDFLCSAAGATSTGGRVKQQAEQELLAKVKVTDYYQENDTITVGEAMVRDAEQFFKLMATASNNQAFSGSCHFEVKPMLLSSSSTTPASQPTTPGGAAAVPTIIIDQPPWFKPKSFHSFATWVLVALEENLWAHYNYDLCLNMTPGIKQNDVAQLFRDKGDSGAMDVEIAHLADYWRELADGQKKVMIEGFRAGAILSSSSQYIEEAQQQAGGSINNNKHKVVQSKTGMSYSLSIKERNTSNPHQNFQQQEYLVDLEIKPVIELAMNKLNPEQFIQRLMYTAFDKIQLKQVALVRKFLDLIKKKYKDDLMENLLKEEYITTTHTKQQRQLSQNPIINSQSDQSQIQQVMTQNSNASKYKKKKKKAKTTNDSQQQTQVNIIEQDEKQVISSNILAPPTPANPGNKKKKCKVDQLPQDIELKEFPVKTPLESKGNLPLDTQVLHCRNDDEEEIREYVAELTQEMVDEVCRRAEETAIEKEEETKIIECPEEQQPETTTAPIIDNQPSVPKQVQNNQQRKGFGIHLKANTTETPPPQKEGGAWAKGTARNDQNAKKKPQKKPAENVVETPKPAIEVHEQQSEQQQQIKKKRSKKKQKLTDTDIMNNFMKSLHSHTDDEPKPVPQPSKEQQKKRQQEELKKQKPNAKTPANNKPTNRKDEVEETAVPKKQKQQRKQKPANEEVRQIVVLEVVAERVENEAASQEESKNVAEQEIENTQALKEDIIIESTTQEMSVRPKSPVEEFKSDHSTPSKGGSMNVDSAIFMKTITRQVLDEPAEFLCLENLEQQNNFMSFMTPPQSSKKSSGQDQQFNQLNSAGVMPMHFNQSAEPQAAMNQGPLLNSGNTSSLTNHYKRLPPAFPSHFEQPPFEGLQSTYAGISYYPFLGVNEMQYYNNNVPGPIRSPNLQTSHSQGGYQQHPLHYQGQQQQQKPKPQHKQQQQHHRPHAVRGVPAVRQNQGNNQNQNIVMNLSQSMQEQMQQQQYPFPYSNQGVDTNIFYQAQQDQQHDLYPPQSKPDPQIFPYLLGGASKDPMPTYSPPMGLPFQPDVLPFPHFRPGNYPTPPPPTHFHPHPHDQSQDLIFQIVNSIKSNHSMSPVPAHGQITSPPTTTNVQLMDQMSSSHHSSDYPQPDTFFDRLDSEIAAYLKSLEHTLAHLAPERAHLLAELQSLTHRIFPQKNQHQQPPKLEVFGSLTTGLALESSDMDIAVVGLEIGDRYGMVEDLKKLANGIQNEWRGCIEGFKAIETASIPVIKMKVDLVKMREQKMQESEPGEFEKRLIPEGQRLLSVDITFDDSSSSQYSMPSFYDPTDLSATTKTHLGLASCRLVQHYLATYRHLKPVVILLKRFLALHSFNSPYYGGLSSYSSVLLIIAFMNCFGLYGPGGYYISPQIQATSEEMTPGRLLMCFLDFYVNCFNPAVSGISVVGNGSFIPLTNAIGGTQFVLPGLLHSASVGATPLSEQSTANFVILDPLNTANNTTKNSFLTRDILKSFQSAFNNLRSKCAEETRRTQVDEEVSEKVDENILNIFFSKEAFSTTKTTGENIGTSSTSSAAAAMGSDTSQNQHQQVDQQ